MLGEIRAEKPLACSLGGKCVAPALRGSRLFPAFNGVVKDTQIHWSGQRGAGTLAQLPKQLNHSRGNLEAVKIQVSSCWAALPDLVSTGDEPHVSSLREERRDVSLSAGSNKSGEVGPMAHVSDLLLPSRPRLRSLSAYCALRCGVSHPQESYGQGTRLLDL